MMAKGHLALTNNVALFLVLIDNYIYQSQTILSFSFIELLGLYLSMITGTLIVDIDEPNSYIGRRLTFLSYPFKIFNYLARTILYILLISDKNIHRFFKYRGFTHTFLFFICFLILGFFLIDKSIFISFMVIAFSIGILSHQIGDVIFGGIYGYLFPIMINFKLPFFLKTDGKVEYIFTLILKITIIVQLFYIARLFTLQV